MLDPQLQMAGGAREVEAGVGPGCEVAAAPKGELWVGGRRLAGVVDKEHSGVVVALDGAERSEHGGDICGRVFIDVGDADEGIEDEQARAVRLDRGAEAHEIGRAIDAQDGDVEEVDGELAERDAGDACESIEAGA
jgi:hypothetical protein